jgi:2-oxo-4-hydroxy-4-carboxy-5-ureidoimidazoline decarboxylase
MHIISQSPRPCSKPLDFAAPRMRKMRDAALVRQKWLQSRNRHPLMRAQAPTRCPMQLDAVNRMDPPSFVAAFGGVFENSPWVAQAACGARPFANIDALHAAMAQAVKNAPPAQQLALLRAHPELAGREARAGDMTDASEAEQASAGLNRLTAAEMARIGELNRAYGTKFGHPFIIAVRKHTKGGIFAEFERRVAHDAATERVAALNEVFTITRLRLEAMFAPSATTAGARV